MTATCTLKKPFTGGKSYCSVQLLLLLSSSLLSPQNHTIERLWVEVNARINYPIKCVLIKLVEDEHISMDNSTHQYGVSWLTIHIANIGIKLFVSSWNSHRIPGMCWVRYLLHKF